MDYGFRELYHYSSFDDIESTFDCLMPVVAYTYPYPEPYNYTETFLGDSDFQNVTKPVDVICRCDENTLCGCDYNGSPAFIKAFGDMHVREEYRSSYIYNTTRICYFPIDGTPTLLINGTLDPGSTKADSSLPELAQHTEMSVCPSLAVSLRLDYAMCLYMVALSCGMAGLMA